MGEGRRVRLSNSRPQGPARESQEKNKEKKPGAGTKNARVKKDLRGQPPLRPKTVPGSLWPSAKHIKTKNVSRKAVSKRPRTMALPGPSLGHGAGSMTRGYASCDDRSTPASLCEKAAKHNRRGKQKQQKETTRTPLPPRVRKQGLRRGE